MEEGCVRGEKTERGSRYPVGRVLGRRCTLMDEREVGMHQWIIAGKGSSSTVQGWCIAVSARQSVAALRWCAGHRQQHAAKCNGMSAAHPSSRQ